MVKLRITTKKDGREVAWYRDTMGRRVGTSMRATTGGMSWSTARQMMELGQYGIQLMLDRTEKGIGSDDAPMPPLKSAARKRWSIKQQKWVAYGLSKPEHGYAGAKRKMGLKPMRDLRGPGGQVAVRDRYGKKKLLNSGPMKQIPDMPLGLKSPTGHMVDDIRVNYVDDTKCTIDISTRASRVKARANEDKAPWWGWSPRDIVKLANCAAEMFKMTVADRLFTLGLIGANALGQSGRWLNPARRSARRAA